MWTSLKQQWCDLKQGPAGHRFQDRYERNREGRADESALRRWIQPVLGLILLAAGIFFCIFPGPGLPLVVLGLMLLAERSLRIARALDWSELKVRKAIQRLRQWWRHASPPGKNATIILVALVITGAGYSAYRILQ